jgi:rod shape determining protein RodA
MQKNIFTILQRLRLKVDLWLAIALAYLVSMSFIAVYSACVNYGNPSRYILIHFLACGLGFLGFFLLSGFNYQYYRYFDKSIYFLSLVLLCLVLIFGSFKRGTKGWFDFGIISFQPVEFTKIMYILVLASFLDRNANRTKKVSFLFFVFAILTSHIFLIMMQPDFSSTLSYFPVTLVLLFVIGIDIFCLFCIIVLGSLAVGIPLLKTFLNMHLVFFQSNLFLTNLMSFLENSRNGVYIVFVVVFLVISSWLFLWRLRIKISVVYPVVLCGAILLGCVISVPVEKSLKDYQRKRLVIFLNPKLDPMGSGYNIIQSKITIGSGRFVGKGYKKGSQTQLGFLPERHTDFIFSVISEEGGWIMSQLTILFYSLFIWRAFVVSKESRDRYGSLVAIGIATMVTFHAIINIGMVTGIMPVTGMPLLFLSYGGSSMFSSLCAVGILSSIHLRKYIYY